MNVILPKGSRTLSGEIIASRHGSDMLDDLMIWLDGMQRNYLISRDQIKSRIIQIEKEYGIDRVE